MPERFNFITSNIEDLAKAQQLMEDAGEFAQCLTLNHYVGYDLVDRYFISGQAIEVDSNAAPLELRLCFENEDITVAFVNDNIVGKVSKPIPRAKLAESFVGQFSVFDEVARNINADIVIKEEVVILEVLAIFLGRPAVVEDVKLCEMRFRGWDPTTYTLCFDGNPIAIINRRLGGKIQGGNYVMTCDIAAEPIK